MLGSTLIPKNIDKAKKKKREISENHGNPGGEGIERRS